MIKKESKNKRVCSEGGGTVWRDSLALGTGGPGRTAVPRLSQTHLLMTWLPPPFKKEEQVFIFVKHIIKRVYYTLGRRFFFSLSVQSLLVSRGKCILLGIYICSTASGLERIFKYTYFIAFRTFYSICKHCKHGRKKNLIY